MPGPDQRRVLARVNQLLRQADRAEAAAVRAMADELAGLQRDVRALLADAAGAPHSRVLAELDRRIAGRLNVWVGQYTSAATDIANLGVQMVDDVVVNLPTATVTGPSPTRAVVEQTVESTRPMLEDVGRMVRQRVNAELTAERAGVQDITATLDHVGTRLEGSRVFGRPAQQLDRVASTELGAVHGAAVTARAEGLPLVKRWISLHGPTARPTHETAARAGWIPVDDLFTVGRYRTPHPRGPGLPGLQKISCRCRVAVAPPEGASP